MRPGQRSPGQPIREPETRSKFWWPALCYKVQVKFGWLIIWRINCGQMHEMQHYMKKFTRGNEIDLEKDGRVALQTGSSRILRQWRPFVHKNCGPFVSGIITLRHLVRRVWFAALFILDMYLLSHCKGTKTVLDWYILQWKINATALSLVIWTEIQGTSRKLFTGR